MAPTIDRCESSTTSRRQSSTWRGSAAAGSIALALLAVPAFAADDLTQPLKASADGHFIVQPNGEPFFWLADTAWDLFQRLDRQEVDTYLSDRDGKGFTVIQASIGGGALHQGPNHYGQTVFIDDDPTKPNPAYFENVDWIIDRAAHYGIRFAVFPYWGGALTRSDLFDEYAAAKYGQWLGQRYRGRGLIWILGGDSNPLWPIFFRMRSDPQRGTFFTPGPIADFRPVYDALAKGLAAGEGREPFITYHPGCCNFPGTPKSRTSLYFGDRNWLTMNMIQSSHYATPAHAGAGLQIGFEYGWVGPKNYEIIAEEYRSSPTRPVIDGEPRYEDLGIDNDAVNVKSKGFWTGYDARNAAYHAVFAGAAGHTYGNHSVWQFYDPAHNEPDPPARLDLPWQKAIGRPVTGQLKHLKALMLSRPYFSRVPDQSLIVGDPGEGTTHIGATRDSNGKYAFVYLPRGQSVTVNMALLSGPHVTAWWLDPRSGAASRIGKSLRNQGTHMFWPPSSGAESDWVLVLDDALEDFPAPGRPRP